jgi:type II secretion system protein D
MMMDRTDRRGLSAAMAFALIAAAGMPISATTYPVEPSVVFDDTAPDGQAEAEVRIRFNFDGVPFDQVLDFFSREAGLPVIRETAVPEGTLKFISGRDFLLGEALEVFNYSLRVHGVRLVHEADFLYLRSMAGAATDARPVNPSELADLSDVDPSAYLTTYIPLNNALAQSVIEQIKPLVREPGIVLAIDNQNLLLLVETAAQCQRLYEVITQIDQIRPTDTVMEVVPLRYSQVAPLVATLKGLIPEREQIMVMDKNQNARLIDDVSKPALKIQADTRINAVVAVGPKTRMPVVKELIAMLDAPEGTESGGGGVRMQAYEVVGVTADEASRQIDALFKALPDLRKPTVRPLASVGRVMIVGTPEQIVQARALLDVIDPNEGEGERGDRAARVIELEHLNPDKAMQIAVRLLTPRQNAVLKYVAAPSGKGLLVVGPSGDVDSLEQLLTGLDVRPEIRQEVRVISITRGDVQGVIDRATALDALTPESDEDPVRTIVDIESRSVTLVGSKAALSRYEQRLRSVEQSAVVSTESRTYPLGYAKASDIAGRLMRLLRPLLEPSDGSSYVSPRIEALDELDSIIVHALPEQFSTIEGLIAQLDRAKPGDRQFQVLSLRGPGAEDAVERAVKLYNQQTAGMDEMEAGAIEYEIDRAAGKLLLTGRAPGLRIFSAILQQTQQLTPPQRTTRIFDAQFAKASDLLEPLKEYLASADSIDPGREVPEATISVIERTNSLMITAEGAQHQMILDYLKRLDQIEPSDLPPLRLLQLRTADAVNMASMLTQQYNKRPAADRMARPVEIRADGNTNTLIVAAHAELFDEIKAFVDSLNEEQSDQPERKTFLFPLKTAKAVNVAEAMNKLFPEPPMPKDRYGRDMPWLREMREITVSADDSSNSLIIDAPIEREESLRELAEKLDRVEVPPVAELRTYQVIGADLGSIARMLQGLSRNGSLSSPASSGRPKVPVVIETEPKSSTLIVAGDEITFEKVEQVLKSLTAVPVEKGLRIIPVANTDAAAIRERALAIYNAQISQIPGANPVDITIDEESNSLEVVADHEAMARFMKIMDELQRQIGPAREVRMIELRLAKVTEVIGFLRELVSASESMRVMGGPEPVFEPIETTNAIMVAAQPSQFAIISQLIQSLDNQQVAERPPLRIMKLRSTDATNLSSVLQRSYQQRPPEERAKKPVDIQADAATNTLIVSAHPEVMPEIEAIVRELNDARELDEADRQIQIYPLRVARAEELAKTIDEMYPEPPMPLDSRGRPRPDLRRPKEIFVRADRATNSLIVDAPTERLAGFEQIVAQLDKAKLADDVELRTYRIVRADLGAVEKTLKGLADSGALTTSMQSPVSITSEPMSRTIVVSGPAEIFDRVETVLKEIDGDINRPTTSMKLYPLEHARADRLKVILEQMLSARLREVQRADGAVMPDMEELLEISADPSSNTLIISAPDAVQEEARQLIEVLDTEAAAIGRATVRVVPLTYADASQVAKTLQLAVPSMDLPSGEQVQILPTASSNAILLAGVAADLTKVEALIEPLDRQPFDPEKPAVETFPLQHADANAIARMVESLLVDQQQTDPRILLLQMRARNYRMPTTPKIHVQAEPRTNSLIVSGPTSTIELARAMIDRLDQPAEDPGRTVLTFTPINGDPAKLAQAVSKIMSATVPQGRRPLEVTAEPTSGSVLVIGQPEEAAAAVAKLADLDERTPALPMVDVRSFDLTHAAASGAANAVRSLLSDQSRWPDALVRAQRAGVRVPTVSVQPESATNRLIVSVPSVLMPLAEQLISTLDQPRQKGAVEVRVYRLEKGNAESVADALTKALKAGLLPGEVAPIITAEPSSNTVVIAATGDRLAQAATLIESMDESVEPAGIGVRTVYLEHAQAEALAPLVQKIIEQQDPIGDVPSWMRPTIVRDLARAGKDVVAVQVRVVAERRLNALVISAPTTVLELAEQVIAGLDVDRDPSGSGGGRVVRVITLANAEVSELSTSIEEMFASDDVGAVPPMVRVDAQSNSLIVRGTVEQIGLIEEIVSKLDAATLTSQRQLRLISVDRSKADAMLMARTLRRMLEQQGGIKVEIISAEELMDRRETPGPSGSARPLSPGLDATRLGVWATGFVMGSVFDEPPEGEGADEAAEDDADDEPTVVIAVDPLTNALMVIGAPRLTDRIAGLVAELESQMPSEPTGVRIVTLPDTADARGVADVVAQTVRQVGTATATNPGGFTGRVAVRPDPSGKAVVVWANATDFDTVSEIIAGVASLADSVEMTIKVYPLANVTARQALGSVQDLFSVNPRGRQAQQLREMTLMGEDGSTLRATINPKNVKVIADPSETSLIVAAPGDAFDLIDRFMTLIDQSPVMNRLAIRRYALDNARATDLTRTLQRLFDAQRAGAGRMANQLPRAQFVADDRTNSMLVTATQIQHEEVARLLATADIATDLEGVELAIIPLKNASPRGVARIIEEVVIGKDPGRRERIQISAEDSSRLFVVKAPPEDLEQIRAIVEQVDDIEVGSFPIRSIKLQQANAMEVAKQLQDFFRERGSLNGRRGTRSGGAAIIGNEKSGTIVVSASDDDFEQVQSLVTMFDVPAEGRKMQHRIVHLKNARVTDIGQTIQNLAWEIQSQRFGGFWGFGRGQQTSSTDRLFVETNERTNSIIVFGQGETLETVLQIITELDSPLSEQTRLEVRAIRAKGSDLNALRDLIEQATGTPGWRSWQGRDPDKVTVEVDRERGLLLLIGAQARVDMAEGYIRQIGEVGVDPSRKITSLQLEHADAARAAQSLTRFFMERARAQGLREAVVSIIGSRDGNVLLISADEEDLAIVEQLVAQIDQPELGNDRVMDVIALKHAEPSDAAALIGQMFPARRADERVIVTPQAGRNAIIVSAPPKSIEGVRELVSRIDTLPDAESTRIATVQLESARAEDVARALAEALPEGVRIQITPVERSNSLLLTGSDEAIALVTDQIKSLDTETALSPVEFRRFEIKHQSVTDVAYTVRSMMRGRPRGPGTPEPNFDPLFDDNVLAVTASADEMPFIEQIILQIDTPRGTTRKTEFFRLEYAPAESTAEALKVFYGQFAPEASSPAQRDVTVVADPATNSLVISADESVWDDITNLINQLDTEEYDTSQQLVVLQLQHADATSVARAINEGLRAPLEEQLRREQLRIREESRNRGRRDDPIDAPTVLVSTEGMPTVSAEIQTNSLIVFAGRKDLARIEAIVKQLDVPGYQRMPEPRIIPLPTGRASAIAQSVRAAFMTPGTRQGSPREVLIIGDDTSSSLIVRADDEQFAQILSLAMALVAESGQSQATPHIIRLANVPAVRLRDTLLETFGPLAQQRNEPLTISVDRNANAIIVASSDDLFMQVQKLVQELDGSSDDGGSDESSGVFNTLGQTVLIVDIENYAPGDVAQMLGLLGVTRAQPADRPGLVSEPVTLVTLKTRRGLAVMGSKADVLVVAELIKKIDTKPEEMTQNLTTVRLKMAQASAVVTVLNELLDTTRQGPSTAPAMALREQIRRLNLARENLDDAPIDLDLSVPIRLIADGQTNSVFVGSSKGNIAALRELIGLLDTLPVGDAVVVRIFPLENSSAQTIKPILDQLFREGERLRRQPGSNLAALPNTAIGQALVGQVAVSVDERTNSLVVAGREEAVALVDVLIRDLDADAADRGWIEAQVISLEFADAITLANKIEQVLVSGLGDTPEAVGLQRQVGRLRLVLSGDTQNDPRRIDSDIFAPMSGLVVTAEENLNALIVIGTPTNIDVVRELVKMLDVELASANNSVRVMPLEHAAAERIAGIVNDMFRQRESLPSFRPEDRVVVSVDSRTNSLVVSTSPRSFSLLDGLLKTLDQEETRFAVGLHVVHVPSADVQDLAPKLERLMLERLNATRRAGDVESPEDVFRIEPEPNTNSLIVASSDENLALLKDFIETLTTGGEAFSSGERLELIPISSPGRAAELAETVQRLYVDKENERRGDGSVRVLPSERQNALIASGTEDDIVAIRGIVARLDGASVETVVDYKRIALASASAREVVSLLEDALAGRSIGGSRGAASAQATVLRVYQPEIEAAVAEATIDGSIREQISLTADLRTNSIMVTAPPEIMNLITKIVEDLDLDRRGDRVIETFQLINADAQAMAVLLGELFNLRQLGDSLVLIPTRSHEDEADDIPGRFTPVPDQRQELSITVDRRTNTLLVSGTQEYLDEVRDVVENLDSIQALEREQRVFDLRNAQASEIELTLQSYFDSEAERRRLTLGPQRAESFIRQLEQEVTVIGDEKSNKLVISASPRYIETVAQIVEELDASPPQVMIQVLIAEVTLDNADSWGVDINIGGMVATSKIGGDGYVFDSLAGGAGVATSLGVPNFSVASTDFTLLLRALEEQGRLEVLSRPHIIVNNNEEATINVGEDIAIVTGVVRDSIGGGTTANVTRRDVGIILTVRPSISVDGFVRVDIAPTISQLSQRVVEIDANFSAPIITQRLVDTTVTVKDGQTVVIGGLIQTIDEDRTSKLKGLGDLPLFGPLFRSSNKSKVKTELLVILTPYVIPGDSPRAELRQRSMSQYQIDQLENPEPVLKALGLEGGLPSVDQTDGPVALPLPEGAIPISDWFMEDDGDGGSEDE